MGLVLAGYRRLTVDRYGNKIGYDVQTEATERRLADLGHTIGKWYEDKDLTAADRRVHRQGYEAMLADIDAGMWEGVAIWRLDRLVRLVREFERCNAVIEDSGGVIISAIDGFSTENDIGKFIMRIMVMLAEMEVGHMRTRARAHQQYKAEHGRYKGGGRRPYGFEGTLRDDDDRILNSGRIGVAHVPHEAELLRDAADKILNRGYTAADVIREWHARVPPVLGATGKPFSILSLQRILTAPRIAGFREYFAEDSETGVPVLRLAKAQWDPILTDDVRKRLMTKLQTHPKPNKRGRGKYLLSGMITCGQCGRPLTGVKRVKVRRGEKAVVTSYRCKATLEDKAKGSCGKLNVAADAAERLIAARVLKRVGDTPDARIAGPHVDADAEREMAKALDIVKECDDKLLALSVLHATPGAGLSSAEWMANREPLTAARERANKTIESLTRRSETPVPTPSDRENLVAWFENLTLDQQRKLISAHIRAATILPVGKGTGPRFNPDRLKVELAPAG